MWVGQPFDIRHFRNGGFIDFFVFWELVNIKTESWSQIICYLGQGIQKNLLFVRTTILDAILENGGYLHFIVCNLEIIQHENLILRSKYMLFVSRN